MLYIDSVETIRRGRMSRLLKLFSEYMEKQEVLSQLTQHEKLDGLSYSEMHTIAAIGDLEAPNVTKISKQLNMTRGAISKIIKRLIKEQLVEAYTREENRKEIYYRLSDKGQFFYLDHQKRHQMWEERDQTFLNRFSEEELGRIETFMGAFNEYLKENIEEIGRARDVD